MSETNREAAMAFLNGTLDVRVRAFKSNPTSIHLRNDVLAALAALSKCAVMDGDQLQKLTDLPVRAWLDVINETGSDTQAPRKFMGAASPALEGSLAKAISSSVETADTGKGSSEEQIVKSLEDFAFTHNFVREPNELDMTFYGRVAEAKLKYEADRA